MNRVLTVPNPDLTVLEDNKSRWTHADHRRWGWHNLHRIARYVTSFRAAHVMKLEKRMNLSIARLESVRLLTSLPWFSGMLVLQGRSILFEQYAADFGPDRPHSIQSITKTIINLAVGQLVEHGALDLSKTVGHYIPEIGSGYAGATVQEVLNMDVVNDYSEDFTNTTCTYYRHEEAMGWRLPQDYAAEATQRGFVSKITSADTRNRTGQIQYKDANSDVMGWIVERVGGRPLRAVLADIADAAGIEGALHITTDREGVPALDGGACLTTRDLARYMSIFARRGVGVDGQRVGSEKFIEQTLSSGVTMPHPNEHVRYSNHFMVSGRALMHGGWAGQYAVADLDTRKVAVFLSVTEDEHAADRSYLPPIVDMLRSITSYV